ncbi:MAG: nitrite reductase small subunit NirD [Bacteroidota bacterium]|nr:nitrite reductase small subunit NirD [Bacteroidota bacterium]MDP4218135.1 nitrite reductase small subunit NirD [Bacteroidota bacterium]MDP4245376.1 nitrite reductase small subunit NirD [Bacteroidota bacterium]MDP4255670.1 nitrite reductase small subunit NirD [Bacteroidota bacterium]MDP4259487.1 nitrite reductase small subunit NirD [Bacteroidota bacterium]
MDNQTGRPTAARAGEKWKWRMACRVDDVPKDGGACVSLDDEQIAIFHFSRRGEWFATQNECPHKQQMALSRGLIGSAGPDNEPKLACPFHKRTFSLLSGECLNDEPLRIAVYPVRIRDGKVFVGMRARAEK